MLYVPFSFSNSKVPIISLRHVRSNANHFPGAFSGLLSATLNDVIYWCETEKNQLIKDYKPLLIDNTRSYTDLQFDEETQHCLVTSRPSMFVVVVVVVVVALFRMFANGSSTFLRYGNRSVKKYLTFLLSENLIIKLF